MQIIFKYPVMFDVQKYIAYSIVLLGYCLPLSALLEQGWTYYFAIIYFMFSLMLLNVIYSDIRYRKYAKEIVIIDEGIKAISRRGEVVEIRWTEISGIDLKKESYLTHVVVSRKASSETIRFCSAIMDYNRLMNELAEHYPVDGR